MRNQIAFTVRLLVLAVIFCCAKRCWSKTWKDLDTGITWEYTAYGEIVGATFPSTVGGISIPSTINGFSVTSIGANAFSGCSNLTDVTMPDSVTSIGYGAFRDCSCLASVSIGESVEGIGAYAFYGCTSLRTIHIPDSVEIIGEEAFANCGAWESVTVPLALVDNAQYSYYGSAIALVFGIKPTIHELILPEGITTISEYTLRNVQYDQIKLPSTLKEIGDRTFSNCQLRDIQIPFGVTNIGYQAFYRCTYLDSITIPSSVQHIGDEAFWGCIRLMQVHISDVVAWCATRFGDIDAEYDNHEYRYYYDRYYYRYYQNGNFANPLCCKYAQLYLNGEILRNLSIPDEVTSISDFAFYGCDSITNLTFGANITTIGFMAFYGCEGLRSAIIPDSVSFVGSCAFSGCNWLCDVTIPQCLCDTDDTWSSESNFTFVFCGSNSYSSFSNYNGKSAITNIVISPGVTNIGRRAFLYCTNLRSITIPSSVTSIENEAFAERESGNHYYNSYRYYGSDGLERVYISDLAAWCAIRFGSEEDYYYGEKYINGANPLYYASDGLYLNGTKLSGNLLIPDGVSIIGDGVFANCRGITNIVFNDTVTTIGDSAFMGCKGIANLVIPDTIASIGSEAFNGCGLISLVIPNTITNIGIGAFSYSENLSSITIPQYLCDGNEWGYSDGRFQNVFPYCHSITNLIIAEGVTNIASRAFEHVGWMSMRISITIPSTLKSVGSSAFIGHNLKAVHISDLAAWCEIDFEDEYANPLTTRYPTLVLNGTPLQGHLEIPEGVTKISRGAFAGQYAISSITIPSSVRQVGSGAFEGTHWITVYTADISSWCRINFEDMYANPLCYGRGYLVANGELLQGELTIPSDVSSVGPYAFAGCKTLTKVTIGENVRRIGERAFYGCSDVTSLVIADSVSRIGDAAFGGCLGLADSDGFTIVRDVLYGYSGESSTVSVPENVYEISGSAFSGRTNITSIAIGDSVRCIGNSAFSGCSCLRDITIPNSITNIGSSAFYKCSALNTIEIPEAIKIIGSSMFYGCDGLTNMTIPIGVTKIESSAFNNCSRLTSITIPDSVMRIGSYAFYGCSNLTSVTIPSSVASIDALAFSGCKGLTRVNISDLQSWCNISFSWDESNPLYYAHNLYLNGELLTELKIPDGVSRLGNYLFYGCTNLTSISLPSSLTSIGYSTFEGCDRVRSVTIPQYVCSSGLSSAFPYSIYKAIENVTINEAVTNITGYAFSGCSGLSGITFECDEPTVSSSSFSGVPSSCYAFVPVGKQGYEADSTGKWKGLIVKRYGLDVGGKGTVEESGSGGYAVTANEGEMLTEDDIAFAVPGAKGAYKVEISFGGKAATVSLNPPVAGVAELEEEVKEDEEDSSGLLADVAEIVAKYGEDAIKAKPTPTAEDIEKGNDETGALPVKTYPGLWYQASWGDDLGSMTEGDKVQATGGSLYLGVIKQKGDKGFYKLSVSEK
ncbi:MAG: leucine-rich repeat domain-containing protein [Kiritimatiellae bacterium]|nr:leucine-rich repeat domain-containing protein [Kiritimatiellia bacterium]